MSYRKDGALEAIRLVHEQVGDLENILADLEEVIELAQELMDLIKGDIRNRDRRLDLEE